MRRLLLILVLLLGSVPAWAQAPPDNLPDLIINIQRHIAANDANVTDIIPRISQNNAQMSSINDTAAFRQWQEQLSLLRSELDTYARVVGYIRVDINTGMGMNPTNAQIETLGTLSVMNDNVLTRITNLGPVISEAFAWSALIDLYFQGANQFLTKVNNWDAYVLNVRGEIAEALPYSWNTCWDFYVWYISEGAPQLDHIQHELNTAQGPVYQAVNVEAQQILLAPAWLILAVFGRPNPVDQLRADWETTIMAWNGTNNHIDDWFDGCLIDPNYGVSPRNDGSGGIVVVDGNPVFLWSVVYLVIVPEAEENGVVCGFSYLMQDLYWSNWYQYGLYSETVLEGPTRGCWW